MTPFLTELEEQLRAAAEREVAPGCRTAGVWHRFAPIIRTAPAFVGVALAMLVLVLGVVLLHHGQPRMRSAAPTVTTPSDAALPLGAPDGPARPLKGAAGGTIEQGTVRIVAEARDVRGGLPWALESFRMTGGQTCVLVGREQSGRVGVIGQDGLFRDDGRFHPFTAYALSNLCGQTDGNGSAFIDVNEPAMSASGNDQDVARGGCRPSAAAARAAHTTVCPAGDQRQVEYGLLGPDAIAVTSTVSGHTATVQTGPGGAFIIVGPPIQANYEASISARLMPGLVTAVRYQNGSTCRPPRASGKQHQSPGCPPVGYVAPQSTRVTSAEVRTPVTATLITAKRWCDNNSGHYIACDGKIPAGYSILPGSTTGSKLLQWSWTARIAASGPNAGYEYAITGGPPCGGGQRSSSPIHAYRGERIVQQSLGGSACTQDDTISVEYRTNVGAGGAGFALPPRPGHDSEPFVGSTTIHIPR